MLQGGKQGIVQKRRFKSGQEEAVVVASFHECMGRITVLQEPIKLQNFDLNGT